MIIMMSRKINKFSFALELRSAGARNNAVRKRFFIDYFHWKWLIGHTYIGPQQVESLEINIIHELQEGKWLTYIDRLIKTFVEGKAENQEVFSTLMNEVHKKNYSEIKNLAKDRNNFRWASQFLDDLMISIQIKIVWGKIWFSDAVILDCHTYSVAVLFVEDSIDM